MCKTIKANDVKEKVPGIYELTERALDNGVVADFFYHDIEHPENPNFGLYFVVCPNTDALFVLNRYPGYLKDIIESNNEQGPYMFNMHYQTVHVRKLTNENYFYFHNECCQAIQQMSIARYGFHEYGYSLPKYISVSAINGMYNLDQNRRDPNATPMLRERYEKAYQKYVSEVHQRYAKEAAIDKKLCRKVEHQVPADYFIKNHLTATYDVVSEGFYEYLVSRLDDFPEFKYYKESKPCHVLKDLSRNPNGGSSNWEKYTEYKEYNIGFPRSQEKTFYKLLIEYNCREYRRCIPAKDLKEASAKPLINIKVRIDDMWNFNSLCWGDGSNPVYFCVDYDKYDYVENIDPREIIVGFRTEDAKQMQKIINTLTHSKKFYFPVQSPQKKKAEPMEHKEYYNPFIPVFNPKPMSKSI